MPEIESKNVNKHFESQRGIINQALSRSFDTLRLGEA